MARAAKKSSGALPEPEINITPLVDVVLVLLIIFMVIAPELEHGERVELPVVTTPDATPKAKLDPITVTMTSTGGLFLEKERMVDPAALTARLREIRAGEPDRRVVIKGDASVRYAAMRSTFALCQEAGFAGISLSVSQRSKAGDASAEREGS